MHGSRFDRLARTLARGTNRRQVISGLLAAAFGAPTGAAAQEAAPATPHSTPAADDTEKWLYIQAFESATLGPDPTDPGEYTLTLTGVDEDVLGFSKRPEREVATVTTAEFASMVVRQVLNSLNATLVASLAGGGRAALIELQTAGRIASAGSVTYWLVVPTEKQVFGPGHLFIEGCRPGCCLCPDGCSCNKRTCANLCL
jgi:hypothetical protein